MWRVGRGEEMMTVYTEGREGGGGHRMCEGERRVMMVYIVLK